MKELHARRTERGFEAEDNENDLYNFFESLKEQVQGYVQIKKSLVQEAAHDISSYFQPQENEEKTNKNRASTPPRTRSGVRSTKREARRGGSSPGKERVGKFEVVLEQKREKKITELFGKGAERHGPQIYEFKGQAPSSEEVKRELEEGRRNVDG